MQKKHVWSRLTPLLSFLLIALFTLTNTASSCKDDDDEIIGESTSSSGLGSIKDTKWYSGKSYDIDEWGDSEASLSVSSTTIYFVDESYGIINQVIKETDTYFGKSTDEHNTAFTYNVYGNKVSVRLKDNTGWPSDYYSFTLEYKNGMLVDHHNVSYEKLSMYSYDYSWLADAKYSVMEDDERCNVPYELSFDTRKCEYKDSQYLFWFSLTVPESSKAYQRKLSSMEVEFKLEGRKSSGKIPLTLLKGKDSNITELLLSLKQPPFNISATFYVFDNKRNKTVTLGTKEYRIEDNRLVTYTNEGKKDEVQGDNNNNNNGNNNNNNNNSSNAETKTYTVKGVSFKMVEVEEGSFIMGDQSSDHPGEKPIHNVKLKKFSIGQTEVTQELWETVMDDNPSKYKGNMLPVQATWDDCQTFITKLNQLTGKQFRMLTEAEWEYAARGGNQSKGYTYSGSNKIEDVAWYYDNSLAKGYVGPHDVATKAPNELGIYDMSGNVWEWCQDVYGTYSDAPQVNPTGTTVGTYRVYRGGGWNGSARSCRVTYRFDRSPTATYNNQGFRLAL